MKFEWDRKKENINIKKHGVTLARSHPSSVGTHTRVTITKPISFLILHRKKTLF